MRHGTRLGVDVGKARVGLAQCDPHGLLATPVETLQRDTKTQRDIQRIHEYAAQVNAIEIVVGLPTSLSGARTPSTEDAIAYARALAEGDIPVRLLDERLSTVTAWNQLHGSGKNQKKGRGVVDQVAAVIILQHALDMERGRNAPAGQIVTPDTTEK